MMNRQTRKHYLLFPLSGLLLISLSSCDLTLQDLVHSSAAASSAAGSQNTEGLTITNKTGSTYGGTVASYSSSGANFSAKATSFDQNSVESTTGFVLPSRGKINILVIPVIMDDYKNNATEANRQKIAKAFFGDPSETSWESVASFYFKSSHKQLLLNGTVSPWYDSGYTTSQFSKLTSSKNSWEPTWNVLEGAIEWYKKTYNTDLSEFDSDSDGIIDSVWLVNSAPDCQVNTGLDQTDFWAYTYSDLTPILAAGDNYGPNYTRIPFRYSWASYDFMEAGYGSSGIDAHTYIHETGHLMGLDDYYVSSTADNYTTNYGPMGRIDMMDYNIIDHNA
jgi:M6 family metalloprotease-like protein